jgi:hypothetical protein
MAIGKNFIGEELASLQLSDIEALDKNATDGKTQEFYQNSQITSAMVYHNRISGVVGNFVERHQVEITVHEKELASSCTCSKSRRICKHAVALLYSWINDGMDFTNVELALQHIGKMKKEQLLEIVTNIIRQNPAAIELFLAKNEPDWDEIELDPEY